MRSLPRPSRNDGNTVIWEVPTRAVCHAGRIRLISAVDASRSPLAGEVTRILLTANRKANFICQSSSRLNPNFYAILGTGITGMKIHAVIALLLVALSLSACAACPPGYHLGPYGRRCWPNAYYYPPYPPPPGGAYLPPGGPPPPQAQPEGQPPPQ